jgi:Mn2+/Fe2+ NRAMP family transporter
MRDLGTPVSANNNVVSYEDAVVRGALGKITVDQLRASPSFKRRLLALLAVVGPGLIVMVGDNDAGGVTTYAQAGQAYGTTLLWTLPVLVIVLAVSQEMVVRLGAVTGVGHGKLLRERFGRFWAAFSVVDLFLLNFLTLVTEFIGVRFALGFFGVSPAISVLIMALVLVVSVLTGKFERWERFMILLVVISLAVFPLMFLTNISWPQVTHGLLVPGVKGGLTSTATIFIIGIVGTTVAPWQLFFQQSNVVDKRITTRLISYERADTYIGSVLTNVAAAAIMIAAAFAFVHEASGTFGNAGQITAGFAHNVGRIAGDLFAVILLEASLIGAATVTLSTAYALGDLFDIEQSLNAPVSEAKGFYLSYMILVAAAAAIVLIPSLPLGLVNLGVQVLAGVLLPSALAFLLILCNDRGILGPWVNPVWLNVLATFIVALLLQLSLILTVVTVVPSVPVVDLLIVTGIPVLLVTAVVWIAQIRSRRGEQKPDRATKLAWSMPASALLRRPAMSKGRIIVLGALRVYLVVAVVLMVISFVRLAAG